MIIPTEVYELIVWEGKFSEMLVTRKTIDDSIIKHTAKLSDIVYDFPELKRSSTQSESYKYPFPEYHYVNELLGDILDCYRIMIFRPKQIYIETGVRRTRKDYTPLDLYNDIRVSSTLPNMLNHFRSMVYQQKFVIVGLYLAMGFPLKEHSTEPFVNMALGCNTDFITAEILINSGASVNNPEYFDFYVSKASTDYRNVDRVILTWLFDHGFDINTRNNKGQTCLHLTQDDKVTRILIDRKIDVNIIDSKGYTALDYAIDISDLVKIKTLVAAGSNVYLDTHTWNYSVRKNRRNRMTVLLDTLGLKVEFVRPIE